MNSMLSVIVLAGWGSLLMAITIRVFEWLRAGIVGVRGVGAGSVRLLFGISSFLLITEGARLIAFLLPTSRVPGAIVALLAAVVVLAFRGARVTQRNIALISRPPSGDLRRILEVQIALLVLYAFCAFLGAAASPSSPWWGAFAVMGFMWLLVTLLLVVWWREGRHGLIRGAVIWALVAWTTVFIPFLMPWVRSRRLLVPAPTAVVDKISAAGSPQPLRR